MKSTFIKCLIPLLISSTTLSQAFADNFKYNIKDERTSVVSNSFFTLGAASVVTPLVLDYFIPMKFYKKLHPYFSGPFTFIVKSGFVLSVGATVSKVIEVSLHAYDKSEIKEIKQNYFKLLSKINYTINLRSFPADKKFQKTIMELPIAMDKTPIQKVEILNFILAEMKNLAILVKGNNASNKTEIKKEINTKEIDEVLRGIFENANCKYNQKVAKDLLVFSILGNL